MQTANRSDPTTRATVLTGAAALGASALIGKPAIAQAWSPTKTIRIIVPFPAGATTDMLARLFAQRMTETLGQTVVVENVGGAGGALGADQVAKAAPDGHTLLFHNITFTTTTTTYQFAKKSRHDIEADFVPISVGAYVPFWLLAHPSVPANDLKEFVGLGEDDQGQAELRLDRPRQHHESDGRGAQTRRRHPDAARAVPRRGAAGDGDAVRPHPVRRRPAVELAAARALGALKAMAVATPSAAMPKVPTVRAARLSQSRAAGLERLPRAQGHARAGGRAPASGDRGGEQASRRASSA